MKKIKIVCILFVTMLVTGCSMPDETVVKQAAEQIIRTSEKISEATVLEDIKTMPQETVKEETEASFPGDYEQVREQFGLTEANLQKIMEGQLGKYAYDYLSPDKQRLYAEILLILQGQGVDVMISTLDSQDIADVFQCVLNDHPEIFYVSGYNFTKYTLGESVRRITFSGTYTMSGQEILVNKEKLEQAATSFLAGIDQNAGEYEKVKFIYENLVKETEYNMDAPENQNICSVFLYGESVCQGYAKAMQYLLDKLSVFSTLVIGTVENGQGHAWNLVRIDGAYYYVDATWGDADYVLTASKEEYPGEKTPNISYDYLCITTRQLEVTHKIENVVPMPRCVEMKDNYYVREGAYFTSYDKERIAELFRKAYENGEELVTIKCSDVTVYEEIKRMLLEAREVFLYLDSPDGMVAYADSNQQLSISFWL